MENIVDIVIEILYYHTESNIVVLFVAKVLLNESMSSLKYNEKINFINRLKYAEQEFFSICINAYIFYEGDDFEKIYEVLSSFKNKKSKINDILILIEKKRFV